jgi:hypothetical protein
MAHGYGAGRPDDAHRTDKPSPDGDPTGRERSDAASRPREWRGRPDWMRREWERRQQMYRAWMEHDSARAHGGPDGHAEARDTYGPDPGERGSGSEPDRHEHGGHGYHEHEDHEHTHGRDNHHHGPHDDHHHPHSEHHGAEQAFERGFERGFVRGIERAATYGRGGHGFGPGGFGYGGFGPGRYGRGFGPGPSGFEHVGHEHVGHGRPSFAGRHGFDGRCGGGVDRILADFVERGWVWFDGDRATLTDEGRAAHDAAFERIRAVRASVADGIDPADLATTLATLEAMARNLGWTPRAEHADATAGEATTDAGAPATEQGTDTDEDTDIEEGTDAD